MHTFTANQKHNTGLNLCPEANYLKKMAASPEVQATKNKHRQC